LYQVRAGRYIARDTVEIIDETILFDSVVLNNYVVLVRPTDTLIIKDKDGRDDSVKVLPTYFRSAIEWELATTIELRESIEDTVVMEQQPRPLTEEDGDAFLAMTVESDFLEEGEEGSRIDARRRVKKAGCSLRRGIGSGGGGRVDQDDDFELIAYKETDDNGEVSFGNLPAGDYRINIQYPGVPMDPESDIFFTIDTNREGSGFNAEVLITEDGIAVELDPVLGTFRKYFKELEVFPNPANRYLSINYRKLISKNVGAKLVDLTGKIMLEKEIEEGLNKSIQLDVSGLKDGIYLLYFFDKANDNQEFMIYKVVVKHE
jgi:hypothetical protein